MPPPSHRYSKKYILEYGGKRIRRVRRWRSDRLESRADYPECTATKYNCFGYETETDEGSDNDRTWCRPFKREIEEEVVGEVGGGDLEERVRIKIKLENLTPSPINQCIRIVLVLL